MSKEFPILFSTDMVNAILADKKVMTRRVVQNVPKNIKGYVQWGFSAFTPKGYISMRTKFIPKDGEKRGRSEYGEKFFKLKYGSVGDILWVRETTMNLEKFPVSGAGSELYKGIKYWYKTDNVGEMEIGGGKWTPSIFMPKVACRIKLRVTKIKVERLQDISNVDAQKEGVSEYFKTGLDFHYSVGGKDDFRAEWPKQSFEKLWKKINGARSWKKNPWVFVYEFERIK